MKNYTDLDSLELDMLRELGNIGTSNAATALSQLLQEEIRITLPEVRIMGYNDAIEWIGGAEAITAGVMVQLSGELNGLLLAVQQWEFVQLVVEVMREKRIEQYSDLSEFDSSLLVEVGNIMISSFVAALSNLTTLELRPTVPSFTVDMQGAILAVPMAVFGNQSDYIMTIGATFIYQKHQLPCRLLLSPDIPSLNLLLEKLRAPYDL